MADFNQAMKWIDKDKKVRRTFWSKQFILYIKKGYGSFNTEQGGSFSLCPDDIKATDWIICEEDYFTDLNRTDYRIKGQETLNVLLMMRGKLDMIALIKIQEEICNQIKNIILGR